MKNHLHYLRITQVGKKKFLWFCACGEANGEGPTEDACQTSYDRHVLKVSLKRIPPLYDF